MLIGCREEEGVLAFVAITMCSKQPPNLSGFLKKKKKNVSFSLTSLQLNWARPGFCRTQAEDAMTTWAVLCCCIWWQPKNIKICPLKLHWGQSHCLWV